MRDDSSNPSSASRARELAEREGVIPGHLRDQKPAFSGKIGEGNKGNQQQGNRGGGQHE